MIVTDILLLQSILDAQTRTADKCMTAATVDHAVDSEAGDEADLSSSSSLDKDYR